MLNKSIEKSFGPFYYEYYHQGESARPTWLDQTEEWEPWDEKMWDVGITLTSRYSVGVHFWTRDFCCPAGITINLTTIPGISINLFGSSFYIGASRRAS